MAESIIDGTGSGYPAKVNENNRLLVDISGANLFIGSVSASVDSIYVQSGIVNIQEDIPTASNLNNPAYSLIYDSNNNAGSIYQKIGTGSYLSVIAWQGFSGTNIGIGSRVSTVSSWSVV